MGDDPAVDAVSPGAVTGACLFLEQHGLVCERAAAASVLLGDAQAQQADLPGTAPQVAVDLLLLGEAFLVRRDLLLHERAGELAQLVQVAVHPPRSTLCHAVHETTRQ